MSEMCSHFAGYQTQTCPCSCMSPHSPCKVHLHHESLHSVSASGLLCTATPSSLFLLPSVDFQLPVSTLPVSRLSSESEAKNHSFKGPKPQAAPTLAKGERRSWLHEEASPVVFGRYQVPSLQGLQFLVPRVQSAQRSSSISLPCLSCSRVQAPHPKQRSLQTLSWTLSQKDRLSFSSWVYDTLWHP